MNELSEKDLSADQLGGSLSETLVKFCRTLHNHGVATSAADSIIALQALSEIDINNRQLFEHTLRLSLLKCPEDRAAFAILFDEFWHRRDPAEEQADEESNASLQQDEHAESAPQEIVDDDSAIDDLLERFDYESFWQESTDSEQDESQGELQDQGESTDDQSHPSSIDLQANSNELRRLVRALANHFQAKNSRRLQSHDRGTMLDLRRVLKKSVRFGGLPIDLHWRRRKQRRPRLILFVDVSRSMTSYAKLLLQFTEAVLRHAWQVEVFLFARQIFHLTEKQLQDEDFDMVKVIEECGGSTRIGENLDTFLQHYDYTLTGNRSIVIMLSDGLDGGDEDSLAEAMERIKERTKKLVWLNPVLAFQDTAHTEIEMAAALPFIDLLAPAHNVECFWDLLGLLQSDRQLSI